ncbi:S-adenosyl-L-methionine-dependent methyltransferase [Nemania sp. FL0916]|nr:S-adenosyl-L-methionine-dependent methyltransferase [Nemania sp. FL0916]
MDGLLLSLLPLTADPPAEHAREIAAESRAESSTEKNPLPRLGNIVVELPASTLTQPASRFIGFVPPAAEIADLAKHIIDYCESRRDQNRRVLLRDFEAHFDFGNTIVRKHGASAAFQKCPSTSADFFVRQTYVASDYRWTSLREEHFACGNEIHSLGQFCAGDTVLVRTEKQYLETFVVESFDERKQDARMRRLWRRRDVDKTFPLAAPNELVYSQHFERIAASKIDRRCLIRVFRISEDICAPYSYGGTGDAFFITHYQLEFQGATEYRPLESTDLPISQGFDPSYTSTKKLQGLDLFCGGGNFGRGIEDGGAVEMKWANDIWNGAIYTYMANTDADRCTPFLGSVDDLLHRALEGGPDVPAPGDVQFICAGSPCPGFSSLTVDKTSYQQRKSIVREKRTIYKAQHDAYQSLVASFASYVDLYRPLYGVLENVPRMVSGVGFRDSCVFSQLVCALVGLGYQVQVLFMDAWSFGSPQKRSRVFLAFTAPGLRTLNPPKPSHSHPASVPRMKLGEMSCGRPFDSRKKVPTPFKFVSIKEAIGDLPDTQDGKADYCIGYPTHRLSAGYTPPLRTQIQCIPTHPYGMNFSKAWWGAPGLSPVMTEAERLLFPDDSKQRAMRNSKAWGRLDPHGLASTITTQCAPTDARVGQVGHWEQNRFLSVMEARRAQGFPDHEVLVGTCAEQYKIIGNSVSRHVAVVLGLAIREAWLGTLLDTNADREKQDEALALDRESTSSSSEDSIAAATPATSESPDPTNGKLGLKRITVVRLDAAAKKSRYSFDPDGSNKT